MNHFESASQSGNVGNSVGETTSPDPIPLASLQIEKCVQQTDVDNGLVLERKIGILGIFEKTF